MSGQARLHVFPAGASLTRTMCVCSMSAHCARIMCAKITLRAPIIFNFASYYMLKPTVATVHTCFFLWGMSGWLVIIRHLVNSAATLPDHCS